MRGLEEIRRDNNRKPIHESTEGVRNSKEDTGVIESASEEMKSIVGQNKREG